MNVDAKLLKLAEQCEEELKPVFARLDQIKEKNSEKILDAFRNNEVSTSDFLEVTGYGYYDAGRDKLEKMYAQIFGAEDALVRPQIMSGTHAIALTMFGILKPGDTLISITGAPYDSLLSIIGLAGDSRNSLLNYGVSYEQIELVNDDFDTQAIVDRILASKVKMVEIQRSRGYSSRKSLSIEKIARVCKAIKQADKDVIIMVDNCYGDLVEETEPTQVGADIIVSSLMKNLGGGFCKSGGYVVGRRDLVEDVAERLSAPGVGKSHGANFNELMSYYKGLFFAPSVVNSSLKTMCFASLILSKLGYKVDPVFDEKRTDIIQTISLGNAKDLVSFCQGLQKGSPVESFVVPEPAETPGYPHPEIMAGGSFVSGSTIELSCDAPMVEPYTAFMQGGLTYEYGKMGILIALNEIMNNK